MKILIVSATYNEAEPLFKLLGMQYMPEISFYQGLDYKDNSIDILISGIGMVSTSYWSAKILHENTYNLGINIGIAGSFNYNLKLGDVVNVTRDIFSEFGAENNENFDSAFEMGFTSANSRPYRNGILQNPTIDFGSLNDLPQLKGITVNTVHGNETSIAKTKEYFNPDIESMEGAAFMFCCLMDGLDFIQLRSISNYVEKRDKTKWEIPKAIENLNYKLKEFLDGQEI